MQVRVQHMNRRRGTSHRSHNRRRDCGLGKLQHAMQVVLSAVGATDMQQQKKHYTTVMSEIRVVRVWFKCTECQWSAKQGIMLGHACGPCCVLHHIKCSEGCRW
jgi:hypothetical protein